ncbi:MAG: VCBS repeat-containing protein [Labilithrix sp.]|nr:VCBS repeat-containing protein [Labilithrix sp.]MCW5811999.1 VCBS repeat-containing protein [Labilithrix sp.]
MRHLLVSFFALGLVIACGSSQGSSFQDPDDAGASSTTSSSGTFVPSEGGASSSGDPRESCASKVLCGEPAICCATGQECVKNACAEACATGVRCGEVCCAAGQVCLSQACVAPGKACNDSFDCEEEEFCEPTIGKCLPQPVEAGACLYKPPVAPLALTLEWSWTESAVFAPEFNQIVNTPMVVDMDGDKIPEVVIVTSKNDSGAYNQDRPAYVRVLEGREDPASPGSKKPKEKWAATVDAYKDGNEVNPRGTPAVGDIDGDGKIDIVAPRMSGGLIAFNADGSLKWKTANRTKYDSVTVAIADMDNDGKAEIVAGGLVFDHEGTLVSGEVTGQALWGSNDPGYGPVSIIADVDGNAASTEQFVVTGNRAMRKNGTMLWDISEEKSPLLAALGVPNDGQIPDGYTAIADLDKDGKPELVVIGQGILRVQEASALPPDKPKVLAAIRLPGSGRGGPPTVADFDKDGIPEIASANGTKYNVFEYDPAKPEDKRLSVKWSKDTQDGSSNVTGSSVFDFEGDGSAEVIYNDECYSRVYRGDNGDELYKIVNSSATIHEMPVLVDVDGDNNTELLVVANDYHHSIGTTKCEGYDAAAGEVPRHGIFAYGDANDRWVRTRKVWNQHAYHITNVTADGKIPQVEPRSFTVAENNDYRVSSQGKGVYNAPDLLVDLEISLFSCPTAIDLRARVKNQGALGVPAGVKVKFYLGADATGTLLGEKLTTKPLLPGESEVLTLSYATTGATAAFFVVVEGTAATGVIDECLTDNNTGKSGGIRCPGVN